MKLKKLALKSVRQVFNIAGDLLVDIVFVKKGNHSFDFSTAEATLSTTSPKPFKCLVIKETTTNVAKTIKAVVKQSDIPDINLFDEIRHAGKSWKISEDILQDEYLTIFEATTEL